MLKKLLRCARAGRGESDHPVVIPVRLVDVGIAEALGAIDIRVQWLINNYGTAVTSVKAAALQL
jgi:hypothetical protein